MMDLRNQLIESGTHPKGKRWKASIASLGVHGALIALIVFISMHVTQRVAAENKPVMAFLSSKSAPPPPPPPPPPAASHAASTPKIVKPVQIPQQTFVQPQEIPKEVPKIEIPTPTTVTQVDTTPSTSTDPPGAQEGGVAGGVAGGVVGGQIGGTVGGVVGGQIGGVLGGTPGGTGDSTATPPAPDPSQGPLRVGGDVKAPVAINRSKPDYTDAARKGHITGVVIVETIVNKQGEVEQVKVLKGLPLGLSEQAVEAVKKWRFHPGTLNGQPVEVVFTLTVNFTLE
jgi:periplasmic protein TonB